MRMRFLNRPIVTTSFVVRTSATAATAISQEEIGEAIRFDTAHFWTGCSFGDLADWNASFGLRRDLETHDGDSKLVSNSAYCSRREVIGSRKQHRFEHFGSRR